MVQVNGKVRDRIEVSPDADEDDLHRSRSEQATKIQPYLDGVEPRRVIAKAPKIVNFVL
ncbi:MAG: hypothetical protein V9F03_12665 [Microthrixaceae bacterium]